MSSMPCSIWQTESTTSRLGSTQKRKLLHEVRKFLREHEHPFASHWADEHLLESTICRRFTGDTPDALVWFWPFDRAVASLHLCVASEVRGKWITPRTLRVLSSAARESGYVRIVATPELKAHAALLKRAGFKWNPLSYYYQLDLNGQAQDSRGP